MTKHIRTRYVTTKRPNANDTLQWVLGHYDELDRTLLSEAVRVIGLTIVSNQQWNAFWSKRGFETETEALAYAQLKNMPAVVRVDHQHIVEALRAIKLGAA